MFLSRPDEVIVLMTVDGPFNYEYDIHNALNGGKGTFFLNVRHFLPGLHQD